MTKPESELNERVAMAKGWRFQRLTTAGPNVYARIRPEEVAAYLPEYVLTEAPEGAEILRVLPNWAGDDGLAMTLWKELCEKANSIREGSGMATLRFDREENPPFSVFVSGFDHSVQFNKGRDIHADGETPAIAICRAWLALRKGK